MVVQNISANGKETDLTFTIKTEDLKKTKIIESNNGIKFRKLLLKKMLQNFNNWSWNDHNPGVTFRMFKHLQIKKLIFR